MGNGKFTWRDPRFTYADVLTMSRLILLPFALYGLAGAMPGMTTVTLAVMIGTDLVDGRIARRLGQQRDFGAMLDSTIDWLVIYSLFTTFFAVGALPWWKWLPIFFTGLLIAGTQILNIRKASALVFHRVVFGKLVGQIQFVYLPLLLARTFWLRGGWVETADHAVFAVLAAAMAAAIVDHVGTLIKLLRAP